MAEWAIPTGYPVRPHSKKSLKRIARLGCAQPDLTARFQFFVEAGRFVFPWSRGHNSARRNNLGPQ
jgi:hypothetical protein